MHKTTDVMKIFGDFWILRIVDILATDSLRFCELQRKLDDLNPGTLTAKLKLLESEGVISKAYFQVEENQTKISSHAYALTDKGKKSLEIIAAIYKFSSNGTLT